MTASLIESGATATPPARDDIDARVDIDDIDDGAWRPGRIAWFNTEKGFGLLIPDGGGEAVFVRDTVFSADDVPAPGRAVLFAAVENDRGLEAVRVRSRRAAASRSRRLSGLCRAKLRLSRVTGRG